VRSSGRSNWADAEMDSGVWFLAVKGGVEDLEGTIRQAVKAFITENGPGEYAYVTWGDALNDGDIPDAHWAKFGLRPLEVNTDLRCSVHRGEILAEVIGP